jgi:hypothetical protein
MHEAWLPILHTDRGAEHFTALSPNTARAHELGHTRDWVVLFFYDGDHREGQCTVVTETRGRLRGRRVVRGREQECEAYYGAALGRRLEHVTNGADQRSRFFFWIVCICAKISPPAISTYASCSE